MAGQAEKRSPLLYSGAKVTRAGLPAQAKRTACCYTPRPRRGAGYGARSAPAVRSRPRPAPPSGAGTGDAFAGRRRRILQKPGDVALSLDGAGGAGVLRSLDDVLLVRDDGGGAQVSGRSAAQAGRHALGRSGQARHRQSARAAPLGALGGLRADAPLPAARTGRLPSAPTGSRLRPSVASRRHGVTPSSCGAASGDGPRRRPTLRGTSQTYAIPASAYPASLRVGNFSAADTQSRCTRPATCPWSRAPREWRPAARCRRWRRTRPSTARLPSARA
jgi:hypothetical protein